MSERPLEDVPEFADLGEDERAEVIEDLAASLAARRALESIQAGEPMADWEHVKARLDL